MTTLGRRGDAEVLFDLLLRQRADLLIFDVRCHRSEGVSRGEVRRLLGERRQLACSPVGDAAGP